MAIFAAVLLGVLLAYVDFWFSERGWMLPVYLTTNASSARSILSTIAGATVSFAGTAFSVSLLVIQLGSSQFSPRVVHTLFKDNFNRRVVALVMGTFTYCLVVMRSVENPITNEDDETSKYIVPNISVATAFILGILSLLATVAFIDHSANSMDVSQLFERITRDTLVHIEKTWPEETKKEESNRDLCQSQSTPRSQPKSQYIQVKLKEKSSYVAHIENYTSSETNNTGNDKNGTHNTALPTVEKLLMMDPDEAKHRHVKFGENIMESSELNKKDASAESQHGENDDGCPGAAYNEKMDDCYVVRFRSSGWIQEIDTDALLSLVPPNGYIELNIEAGRYACPGSAVCSVYPHPKDFETNRENYNIIIKPKVDEEQEVYDQEEEFGLNVLDTIMIGYSRTIRSDATYGLRQLVDICLRALSPGINDPTTAQDGIFHIAAVVTEFLQRTPPSRVLETDDGGKLYRNEQPDYERIVRLGFEEIRVCAASSPVVAIYVLEALRLIRDSLQAIGRPRRAPEIERQARLMEESIRNSSHIKEDYECIMRARQDRFDTGITFEPMGIRGDLVA